MRRALLVFVLVLAATLLVVDARITVWLGEGAVSSGEHCGCAAGKNACGMPCVSCCAPGTCSQTETPSCRR